MATNSKTNHGEGNPEAGKRFNEAETRFVESARGKQKVRDGANIRSDEESALADAERLGTARAKGADAAVPDSRPRKR
jgi:hypothetical protein